MQEAIKTTGLMIICKSSPKMKLNLPITVSHIGLLKKGYHDVYIVPRTKPETDFISKIVMLDEIAKPVLQEFPPATTDMTKVQNTLKTYPYLTMPDLVKRTGVSLAEVITVLVLLRGSGKVDSSARLFGQNIMLMFYLTDKCSGNCAECK